MAEDLRAQVQSLTKEVQNLTRAMSGFARREDVDNIRRLLTEFQKELTQLGVSVDAATRSSREIEGAVTRLHARLADLEGGAGKRAPKQP